MVERDRFGFDGDTARTLEVHTIEKLLFHLSSFNGASPLEESVRERALAVVDVGDDAKVSNFGRGHFSQLLATMFAARDHA